MHKLMTRHFSKWAEKQQIPAKGLSEALEEVALGHIDANLGGHLIKKRIRFKGRGKSGSGRTIICFKQNDRAIFVHGFAKNQKANLSRKEQVAFKELSKVLLGLSLEALETAIKAGDFIEVE